MHLDSFMRSATLPSSIRPSQNVIGICGKSMKHRWITASICRHSSTGGDITLIEVGRRFHFSERQVLMSWSNSAAQAQARIKILEKVGCSDLISDSCTYDEPIPAAGSRTAGRR